MTLRLKDLVALADKDITLLRYNIVLGVQGYTSDNNSDPSIDFQIDKENRIIFLHDNCEYNND